MRGTITRSITSSHWQDLRPKCLRDYATPWKISHPVEGAVGKLPRFNLLQKKAKGQDKRFWQTSTDEKRRWKEQMELFASKRPRHFTGCAHEESEVIPLCYLLQAPHDNNPHLAESTWIKLDQQLSNPEKGSVSTALEKQNYFGWKKHLKIMESNH